MRISLSAALAAAVLTAGWLSLITQTARAAESDGTVDAPRRAAFDQGLFGPAGGAHAAACFVRRYDAAHLARHPHQKVTAMRVLVSRDKAAEGGGDDYSFNLGIRLRSHKALYVSAGSCHHSLAEDGSGIVQFGCGVDCDGGGFAVALAKDGEQLTLTVQRLRIWRKGRAGEDTTPDLEAGADDADFRLDRASLRQCDGLIENQNVAVFEEH